MKRLIRVAIILALVVVAGGAVWYFGPFRRNGNVLTLPGTVEIQEVRLGSKVGGRVAAVTGGERERDLSGGKRRAGLHGGRRRRSGRGGGGGGRVCGGAAGA